MKQEETDSWVMESVTTLGVWVDVNTLVELDVDTVVLDILPP